MRTELLLIGAPMRAELLLIAAELLLIAPPLCEELLLIFVRHTVRIGEQSHRPIDIKMCSETLGEPLDGVERDIVQCVQFAYDDGLDQLIDADRATLNLVMLRVVDLVNEVPSEQDVYRRWLAYGVLLGNGLQSLTNESLLEARARNPIECNIKNYKVILQYNFGQCPKVALRIRGTDPEVRLGLQSKDAGTQELMRAKQHVLLESLHVDFDIVSPGD